MTADTASTHEFNLLDHLERDEEGFLLDASEWRPEMMMPAFAAEDELALTTERRTIILYIREYLENNLIVPEARTL